ncbi:MAG: 3-hydroxyacyl-CoA dehydrogenase NAD-binding domain-containing protein [Halieaceae bacterium]|jgi:3-hydroxybutyryl-CoA dehydrogenase|nr:3-hydroxyacyl-CoA dehydrogenase NAD-binding domain-containing protein [Halieaceae bacterium]
MTIEEVKTVCYVGAGTMGCYNSLAAAISGYKVVLCDVDEATLQRVPARHAELAAMLIGGGYCTQDALPAALQRVSLEPDLHRATANADLVSESVFERLAVKRETHRMLDDVCPAHTLLTTNSSSLLVSEIETAVRRGDRFAALHSHLGAPLVDIVGGPRTSASTIDVLQRYVLSTGGVPLVLKKEYPGYVLNAMLGPLLTSAMLLLADGVASIEDVDRAWMTARGAAMGPFGMMDLFGVNVIHDSWQYRREDAFTARQRPKILALLQPMIDAGALGMKSGRGFYSYPGPGYQHPDFPAGGPGPVLVYNALQAALIGNAVLIAAADVAEPADIDRAWKTGTFLDTGPFDLLAQLGVAEFVQMLEGEVAAGRFISDRAGSATRYLRGHLNQLERT